MLAGVPLALIAIAIAAFALLGGPGPGRAPGAAGRGAGRRAHGAAPRRDRADGPQHRPRPGQVAQVAVADAYVSFETEPAGEVGRLGEQKLTLDYPWQEGSPYAIFILTSTGATIEHEIDVAVETPEADAGFFGLMTVLGTYVGVIPVLLGMLFLPLLRHVSDRWIQLFMALTIGLLAFLALDGYLEGTEIGAESGGAFGGVELLFLGAAAAYLTLMAIDRKLRAGIESQRKAGAGAYRLSLMVAIGIGLHNLGEGLAIGSAYAIGALALGAFLVIGFAIHNTTEGLAIVAPLARGERPPFGRLVLLGVIAGAPAILGAVIGASVYNQELATLLIGVGVGAIIQVIGQLLPSIRDSSGQRAEPAQHRRHPRRRRCSCTRPDC